MDKVWKKVAKAMKGDPVIKILVGLGVLIAITGLIWEYWIQGAQ
jgi:hypothetical protein